MNNYVVYHLHTMDSLLDSCTSYQDYIDYAASLGQTAIAFTEHGNIYNWYKKKQYAESKGMKYLHGIECYLTEKLKDPDDKKDKNIRDNYHTILIAKDYDGFVELNNLFYLSTQLDHTYYKPRLSFDDFFNISDHIIKISACVQSPLNRFRSNVKERGITEHDKVTLKKLLKHYDYYEIQYHHGEQIAYNQYLYKMSKKYNKPLIVGTDTHSLNKYKAECRIMLQYGKTDGAWGDEENEYDLTYKTYDELVAAFEEQDSLPMEVIYEAIENTNRMADSVEHIQIDTHNKYPILYGEKDEEVLWDIIKKNYRTKRKKGIISDDKQYIENIKEEMRVFKKIDMIGFMLFMSEIMTWARNNHIATGFARGSVAGSTVAFITNITDVDPIKWDTVFSRFANENRIEAGDIDTDWYEDDRQKIYDYIIDRFGKDKTAYILAMGTLAEKSVIDTIGKAFRIKAQKNNETTEYTLSKIKEIKEEYDADPDKTKEKYPDIFYYYDGLSNCIVSQSQHPAGIIVSSVNLTDACGRFRGTDGQTILPIDMDECHDMGQIKYDILGLKSVGVIDKTCKMIGRSFPKAYQIDWNDQEVYKDIANDHTAIFQFESDYSGECLKKMKPKSVEELSLVNACIRPSGETYRDDLLARHIHHNPSKIIDDMLATNLGYLCIEENEKVSTIKGQKSIKDIQIGDIVYTENGQSTVDAVIDNGWTSCISIQCQHNTITCTHSHKILTSRGYIEAKNIKVGDCVAVRVGTNATGEYNHDKLRLIGYLIGDGCLSRQRNTVYMCNLNKDVVDDFTRIVETFDNCTTRERTEPNGLYYRIVKFIKPSKQIGEFNSYLNHIGIHHKLATEKSIPSFIFELNKNCLLEFLGSYTDTDCNIKNGKHKVCTYKTSSVSLKDGLVEIIRLIGYTCNVVFDNKTNAYGISVQNPANLLYELYDYSFKIRANYLKGELNLSRSNDNLVLRSDVQQYLDGFSAKKIHVTTKKNQYITVETLKKYNDVYCNIPDFLLNDKIKWVKVKKVDIINNDKHVYDLTIHNEHNFVCQGIIVHNCYQEDTIAFLQNICGFSGSEADSIRRAIGKKKEDEINAALPKILDGYCAKSDKPRKEAEQEAKEFLDVISSSSSYQFGKNHSIAYSLISYLMGYLRHYYPTEFCTAFLNCAKNDEDIQNGTLLATSRGCKIVKPIFRYSKGIYTCDSETHTIYKGLSSIKYMSNQIADELYAFKDNTYNTFIDLLIDLKKTSINSRQLDILIKLDFFKEFGHINALLKQTELFGEIYEKKQFKKDKLAEFGIPEYIVAQHSQKQTDKMFKDVDSLAVIKDICAHTTYQKTPILDKIQYEFDYLGYCTLYNKKVNEDIYYIVDVLGSYKNLLYLYNLHDGHYEKIKYKKNMYLDLPEKGRVIKVLERTERNKMMPDGVDENGKKKFITLDEKEIIVSKYSFVY